MVESVLVRDGDLCLSAKSAGKRFGHACNLAELSVRDPKANSSGQTGRKWGLYNKELSSWLREEQ